MLMQWLTQLEPVHRATTREEREAIYRFRYSIYVEEFGRELSAPDHERQWVTDEDDEKDYSTLLYTGSVDDVTGSVRLRTWRPGEVPHHEFEELSMDLVPDIGERHTAEIGRFMIRRSMRGKLILGSFARTTYDILAGEKKTDLIFSYSSPGLVRYYRRLGARPFGGRLVHTVDGMMVPLVTVISDYDYYKRVGSPLAPLVRRYFGRGKRTPVDLAPLLPLFESDAHPVELEPEKIWKEAQDALLEDHSKDLSFIDALPPEVLKRLAGEGFIMDVPEGTLVTREGYGEREMFVVLDGLFEAVAGERKLRVMGRGELFGEVAFFSESGRRTASVRAATGGRVLVVRAKSLDKMIKDDAATAARILLGIGSIMAERLASVVGSEAPEAEEGQAA